MRWRAGRCSCWCIRPAGVYRRVSGDVRAGVHRSGDAHRRLCLPESARDVRGGGRLRLRRRHERAGAGHAYRAEAGGEVLALSRHGLLVFVGFHAMVAWGAEGLAWQTARLSWEGIRITGVEGGELRGFGWEMATDKEVEFAVDLRTGAHSGGGFGWGGAINPPFQRGR